MIKRFLSIFLTFLLTLAILSFQVQVTYADDHQSESSGWWSSEWRYRRRIDITENSGYSLTNWPVEVTFNHDGKAQLDGDDIRVIVDGIEVPSYVSDLNGTHAKVVFEVNVTASSIKTVYVYYGNPDVAKPNYPLVPLTISEGNNGHAIIDNLVYIGWAYTSWGWSNNVELWNDFRIDFDGDRSPTNNNDLIRDYGTRQGGIGRHRRDIEAIGLGEYRGYTQTPVYVEIKFADATLRVYRNHPWVETTQADFLHMFSNSYTHANYGGGTEQNLVDGKDMNIPPWFDSTSVYASKENPGWMAFRDSSSGNVFASTGLRIRSDYAYHIGGKEASDWDRAIYYLPHMYVREIPLGPYDQPPDCRIYWYGDNSNDYSNIEIMGQIFNNQPSVLVGNEEPQGPYVIIDQAFVSDERADVGSTQKVGLHAKWDNGSDVINGTILVKQSRLTPTLPETANILFFDDFNDGVAEDWTEQLGSWNVIDREYFTSVGIANSISTIEDLTLDDYIIETKLRFRDTSVGFRAGIVFRFLDNEHYYIFQVGNEYDKVEYEIYTPEYSLYGQNFGGLWSVDYPIDLNVNYTLRVEVVGNTFTGFLNGEKILSVTDDSYKSGRIGLFAHRADVFFDNFTVYSNEVLAFEVSEVSINEYAINSTGWVTFNVSSSTIGKEFWTVAGVNASGVRLYSQLVEDPAIIWDRVLIPLEISKTIFSDEFNITALDPIWTIIDPYGGSTFDLKLKTGYLTITTSSPPDRDLWSGVNFYAPRILQPAEGDFVVETKVWAVTNANIQSAGILLWKDENNFLRLERAQRYHYQEILFVGTIDGVWSMLSPEVSNPGAVLHIPSINPTYLRIRRAGKVYSGYYSDDGTSWNFVSNITMVIDDPIQAGLYVLNRRYPESELGSPSFMASFDYLRIIDILFDGANRIDTGENIKITHHAIYEYDREPFVGSVVLNDTSFSQYNIGKRGYRALSITDKKYGLSAFTTNEVHVVWDRVNVTLSILNPRVEVGSTANISWAGVYEYDGQAFSGSVTLNDTLIKNLMGRYGYTVASIIDPLYGLTSFSANEVHCIFDSIKAEYALQTWVPGSIRVIVNLKFEYDGSPVDDAEIRVSEIRAINVGGGVYEATISSWMPSSTVFIEVEREGFESITFEASGYLLGNILSEASFITIVSLITILKLNSRRNKRKNWLSNLEKIEELVREKGRVELMELSETVGVNVSDAKEMLSELLKAERVIGTFTTDGEGFVTQEKLKEEIRRGLK